MEIVTQYAPKIIGYFIIKYFSKILPSWVIKRFPFDKEKLFIFIDMPRIINRNDLKKMNFSLSVRNFNYTNIIIEKIKIEINKDSYIVHEFENSFTEIELQRNYNWKMDLPDAIINRYLKYFIEDPNLEGFYYSKGEFDFRIKVFYSFLDKKGSTDYQIRRSFDMDCR
ncbi:MAG: hypothetical protein HW421_2054 [Ignavibacteria bacterium]|nr:hypothetical protein [Ignavibacteria bacterium]